MGTTSHPTNLIELLGSMGAAGDRLNAIDAVEAGAGNISVAFDWQVNLSEHFDATREIDLPWTVPDLFGYTVLVTGSGCRLRGVIKTAVANVGAVVVHEGGRTGTLHYLHGGNFERPTSEFNSHLAVHEDQISRKRVPVHAVIHAQPPNLVILSHNPAYQADAEFNRAILRWEPETIVQIPRGVKYLPFMVPGSQELMENNVAGLREHPITIWSKHGVMACSDVSPLSACDKIEYAETGAMYELRNLAAGGGGEGLSDAEIRRVIDAFAVDTDLF